MSDLNKLYRPPTVLSLFDSKPLVRGKLSPATQGNLACRSDFRSKSVVLLAALLGSGRRGTLLGSVVFRSRISFALQNKFREGQGLLILTGGFGRPFCLCKEIILGRRRYFYKFITFSV